jgi:hypothetical protein
MGEEIMLLYIFIFFIGCFCGATIMAICNAAKDKEIE